MRSSLGLSTVLPSILVPLLAAALAACDGDPSPAGGAGGGGATADLVVVHSDYVSASVSLVDAAALRLAADGVIHSGSRAPQLTTALSGDVALPSTADPRGRIVLIDRYPNGVLTFVDPASGAVTGQISVATGFAANPQDVAFLPDGRAYVTRLERNPTPTPAADDWDEGDDLLIVDPVALAVRGRIPLADLVEDDGPEPVQARPGRVALAGGRVWVALASLAAAFDRGAPGVVVRVDPARDAVDARVVVTRGANCAALAVAPGGAALWVACSGVYQEGRGAQLARSGLARVDLAADPPVVDRWYPAATLGPRPLAAEIAVDGAGGVFAAVSGDLDSGAGDRLVRVDPATGAATTVFEAAEPFTLGGLLLDAARERIWVADADPRAPTLRVFALGDGAPAPVGALDAGPGAGLPPRGLAWLAGPAPIGTTDAAGAADAGGGDGARGGDRDGGGGPAAPTPDTVVSVAFGPGAGYGQDRLPGCVLDLPAGLDGGGPTTEVVALGDGGSIVLGFEAVAIVDGPGPDLRVFENVFVPNGADARDPHADVAVVAVSADGEDWRTFPFDYVPGGAAVLDRFVGFAGLAAGGDAFDLADVGLAEARFVRIRDAGRAADDEGGGAGSAVRDADGEFLDDPGNACCGGESEGFDLDGVIALNWR